MTDEELKAPWVEDAASALVQMVFDKRQAVVETGELAEPVAVEELSFEQAETAGRMKNPSAANATYVFQRGRGAVLIGGQAKGVFREVMARSLNDERRPAAKRRTVAQSGPLCNGEYRRKLTIP